eukprot:361454-Prymnesium_polylepis.1
MACLTAGRVVSKVLAKVQPRRHRDTARDRHCVCVHARFVQTAQQAFAHPIPRARRHVAQVAQEARAVLLEANGSHAKPARRAVDGGGAQDAERVAGAQAVQDVRVVFDRDLGAVRQRQRARVPQEELWRAAALHALAVRADALRCGCARTVDVRLAEERRHELTGREPDRVAAALVARDGARQVELTPRRQRLPPHEVEPRVHDQPEGGRASHLAPHDGGRAPLQAVHLH